MRGGIILTGCMATALLLTPVLAQARPVVATITVQGHASIDTTPDMLQLSLSAYGEADNAIAAKAMADKQLATIQRVLDKQGIAKDNLHLQHLNMGTYTKERDSRRVNVSVQSQNPDSTEQRVFTAHYQMQVNLHKPDALTKLLDALVQAGVERIDGVSYSLRDASALEEQALRAAVKDARHQAEIIASAQGQPLGALKSIKDQNYRSGVRVQAAPMMIAKSASLPAGETSVSATVTAVYTLEATSN